MQPLIQGLVFIVDDDASVREALAWLLRRSPNILLIPGTSSVSHLRENLQVADIELPDEAIGELNAIGTDQG